MLVLVGSRNPVPRPLVIDEKLYVCISLPSARRGSPKFRERAEIWIRRNLVVVGSRNPVPRPLVIDEKLYVIHCFAPSARQGSPKFRARCRMGPSFYLLHVRAAEMSCLFSLAVATPCPAHG